MAQQNTLWIKVFLRPTEQYSAFLIGQTACLLSLIRQLSTIAHDIILISVGLAFLGLHVPLAIHPWCRRDVHPCVRRHGGSRLQGIIVVTSICLITPPNS